MLLSTSNSGINVHNTVVVDFDLEWSWVQYVALVYASTFRNKYKNFLKCRTEAVVPCRSLSNARRTYAGEGIGSRCPSLWSALYLRHSLHYDWNGPKPVLNYCCRSLLMVTEKRSLLVPVLEYGGVQYSAQGMQSGLSTKNSAHGTVNGLRLLKIRRIYMEYGDCNGDDPSDHFRPWKWSSRLNN